MVSVQIIKKSRVERLWCSCKSKSGSMQPDSQRANRVRCSGSWLQLAQESLQNSVQRFSLAVLLRGEETLLAWD
jgi:hypothetical protein